jgi:hypothetical protein
VSRPSVSLDAGKYGATNDFFWPRNHRLSVEYLPGDSFGSAIILEASGDTESDMVIGDHWKSWLQGALCSFRRRLIDAKQASWSLRGVFPVDRCSTGVLDILEVISPLKDAKSTTTVSPFMPGRR